MCIRDSAKNFESFACAYTDHRSLSRRVVVCNGLSRKPATLDCSRAASIESYDRTAGQETKYLIRLLNSLP